MKRTLLGIIGTLLLGTCVERLELEESLDGQPLLVVDGSITNAAEPYQVKLSYASTTLRVFDGTEVSGAKMYIADSEGRQANLVELAQEPGTYQTDSATFRGKIGGVYTLHITMPDGQVYASQPENILPVAPIDTIYYALESRTLVNELNEVSEEWGLQFYLDAGSGEEKTTYYRWSYVETYRFFFPEDINICYQTLAPAQNLYLRTTEDLRIDKVLGQMLHFVPKQGRKLQIRYSALVRQEALSEQAYIFWQQVQQQRESVGSVFDPPPTPIAGNIYNINDDREIVLGYFSAVGVTEKRVFITRDEVPTQPGEPPSCCPECETPVPPRYCSNCLWLPSTTTKPPPFW